MTFDVMINSPLGVHGSFWYFSGLNFIGFLFFVCFVKESRGLTDIEKKTLYSPINVEVEELLKNNVEMTVTKTTKTSK
jgi:hypothetical protein